MKNHTSLSIRTRVLAVGLALAGGLNAGAVESAHDLASSSSGSGSGSTSGTVASQTATAATTATSQTVQASALAQRAQASLQQSLQALQAQQAAPECGSRDGVDVTNTVPNGLVVGGLVPDSGLASAGVANPVTTWTNAHTPTQSTSNGQTTVTVVQTAQQALLNWRLSTSAQHDAQFRPERRRANVAQWVAINKVANNIAPSQILGT